MKWLWLFCITLVNASEYAIVFVHLGPCLPSYTASSLAQARLFNPDCPIYLIANAAALENFSEPSITTVPCESITQSSWHEKFKRESATDGFWQYVVERFYYLEEFMSQQKLTNVFHLENDVMLYRHLQELLPTFEKNYLGMIGATFDNDNRCIAGFMYIPETAPLSKFIEFTTSKLYQKENDMYLLGQFREAFYKKYIDHLPIILPAYAKNTPLETPTGKIASQPNDYFNHFDEFQSVFDAAALGQYIGGIDPIHGKNDPGFINESCIFNPAHLNIFWEKDSQNRQVPIATYEGIKHPINNLHIHCKDLKTFSSLRSEPNRSMLAPPRKEKVNYPLSLDPIDVVIYAQPKHRNTLDLCIDHLRAYGQNLRKVVVISTEPLSEKAEWFDEKQFPFSKESLIEEIFRSDPFEKRRYPHHPRNQLSAILSHCIRLYAPFIIPGLSPNILTMEPDVIFLNSIPLMNGLAEPIFTSKGPASQNTHALRLLPELIYGHCREMAPFILMQKSLLDDLFLQLKEIHQEEPWKTICHTLDTQKLYEASFSDFSLYGNFALMRTSQAKLQTHKWTQSLDTHNFFRHQKEGCLYLRLTGPAIR